jgi:hypothetical protein
LQTDTRSVLVGLGRAGAAAALLVLVFIGYCAVALPVSGGSNTDELGPATVFTAGNGCDRGRQQSNRTLHDAPDTRRDRALLYTRPDTVIERPHWNRNALVQLLEGVVSNGTGQAARLVPAGRWQNRHDAGLSRCQVHRVHVRYRRRHLGRRGRRQPDGRCGRRRSHYVRGREVVCQATEPGTTQYRCDLDNIDVGEAVVLNGAGRVAANASGRLLAAEQKAQAGGRGVWRE